MSEPMEKIRVLLLGDSGVGKSSLMNWICHDEGLKHTYATVGCKCDVKVQTCQRNQKEYIVELLEIGAKTKHPDTLGIFFSNKQQFNAAILVHDLTNRKSYTNLWKWIDRLYELDSEGKAVTATSATASLRGVTTASLGSSKSNPLLSGSVEDISVTMMPVKQLAIPLLVVGTKMDLSERGRREKCEIAAEFNCPWVDLNSMAPAGSLLFSDAVKSNFENFFNDAICQKFLIFK